MQMGAKGNSIIDNCIGVIRSATNSEVAIPDSPAVEDSRLRKGKAYRCRRVVYGRFCLGYLHGGQSSRIYCYYSKKDRLLSFPTWRDAE